MARGKVIYRKQYWICACGKEGLVFLHVDDTPTMQAARRQMSHDVKLPVTKRAERRRCRITVREMP